MRNIRVWLMAVLTLLLASGCPPPVQPPTTKIPKHKTRFTWRIALSPQAEKYLQSGWLTTVSGGEEGAAGGVDCSRGKTHDVELRVKGNDKTVIPFPKKLGKVEGGKDCVRWTIVKDDTGPANIVTLDFIDTDDEETGDKEKTEPFGDQCQDAGETCVVAIPSHRPYTVSYHYNAKVKHNGEPKETDPEIEVLCTSCGEP